jgi:subtilase family serine protease
MRSRLFSFILPAVAFFAAFSLQSNAAVQNRIAANIAGSSRSTFEHTIPARALRSTDLGAASSGRTLTGLSLRFNMTDAQQADLTQLLSDQLNPSSPSYHQWLTPEQFGARFGLSAADIAKVSSWLTSQGFKITATARSSTFITFSGTVAQVEKAFGTSIHSLSYNGEQHISNMSDPALPSAVASVVTSISGLNDFRIKPRLRKTAVKVGPQYTASGAACLSGTGTCHYLAPGDFYNIYDVNPLLSNSINGQGITIAVIGQSQLVGNSTNQVKAFRTAAGLSSTNLPTLQLATGSSNPGVISGDVDESQLDVEWAGAVAPSATVLFIYGQDVFNNSLAYAVDSNVAPILSSSYGLCETLVNTDSYSIQGINQTLAQANAQGMTVINAAGDSGATDCDVAGLASEGLAVDFPASSPYVTAAGGTQFSGDVGNPSAYWNSTNTTNSSTATPPTYTSSAIGYIPEQPWNESSSSTGLTAGGAAGGGASAYFAKPAWQTGTGVPNDGSRDVPDFALNSGAIHDGYIVCSVGDCTSGFADNTGYIDVFGGTSVATPTFAGMLAMVEQKLGTGRLGNIGPNLYGLANVANVFHEVASGNNSIYCIQGSPNCPNGGSIGFNAGVGYDQATGLGSIDTANFVNNWSSGVPTGGGSAIGATLSATTLTTSPTALCGLTNTLAITAKVASVGSSTATPTGTVQLYVDSKAVGVPVALSGGSALLTLDTTTLTSGGHTVNAVYSGDGTFTGSKGSLLTNSTNTGIVSPIDPAPQRPPLQAALPPRQFLSSSRRPRASLAQSTSRPTPTPATCSATPSQSNPSPSPQPPEPSPPSLSSPPPSPTAMPRSSGRTLSSLTSPVAEPPGTPQAPERPSPVSSSSQSRAVAAGEPSSL